MFKVFTHPQSGSDLSISQFASSSVHYQSGLIASLRAEQGIILKLLDNIGQQLAQKGGSAIGGRLELLESRLRRYLLRELGELFAFLEPKTERHGFDEREIVRARREALLTVCRELTECRRTIDADAASLEPTLRRVVQRLRDCFEQQQVHVYPLYHKYGVQQLRAA
ncbi:MAG: hypothetical protein R3202_11640 [Candidatus Competibacterales bacterium]|nr:hypothetical protein [Candidatus Competibacterales bacterium]